MIPAEVNALHHSIQALRHQLVTLKHHYGDIDSVRRMFNDVDRLDIDLHDFEHSHPQPRTEAAHKKDDVIYVPDSKSDESAWLGAQDEGLGFHSRERTK
ncbi:hypothetical protein [Gordonia aurantiaca]|uniref:hypothetical protein n=1 Tax=Gordonia sp. B21 TaxID=3151852 RepID=UPI0032641387